ncbi:MAG: hypothetical protein ACUVV6_07855 [Thermoplasmatota archaeon]
MIGREKGLRALVFKHLRDSDKSISRLARELERDGCRLHRLVLTGYLRGLADMGVLREKDIPPSRVYSLASARIQDIYESLGERLREVERKRDRRARMGVFVFQRLFRRPIFYEELKRAGLSPPKKHRSPTSEERVEARRTLEGAGMSPPTSDPCYLVSDDFSGELFDAICEELVERAQLRSLRQETRQVKLI